MFQNIQLSVSHLDQDHQVPNSEPPGPGPPGPQLIDVTGNMIKHSDAGTILDAIVGLSLHIDFNVMLPTHYGS